LTEENTSSKVGLLLTCQLVKSKQYERYLQ